jgi:putative FmdB family regulatory protein
MPIYEYLCDDCGTSFEKLVRMSDAKNVDCPSCGQPHVTTQMSTFAARGNGIARDAAPSCPSGMCSSPGMCGRN